MRGFEEPRRPLQHALHPQPPRQVPRRSVPACCRRISGRQSHVSISYLYRLVNQSLSSHYRLAKDLLPISHMHGHGRPLEDLDDHQARTEVWLLETGIIFQCVVHALVGKVRLTATTTARL